MARRFFRRYMPHPDRIRKHPMLARIFGALMHKPNLWHLNRHSVSRAFLFGIFWALIPMPFQMIPTAFMCIRFNANLPLAIALVWLTNPLTMPPMMWGQYQLGRLMLGRVPQQAMEFTWESVQRHFHAIWQPLYLGALVSAFIVSALSYLAVNNLTRRRQRLARAGIEPHGK
jgi:uncharacterized protein